MKAFYGCAWLAALGHSTRFLLMTAAGCNIIAATFVGAVVTGLFAVPAGRYHSSPAESLAFPALLPFARNTIYHADSCKARMDDLGNMRCGVLNIGVTHSFSRVTADIVTEFVRLYPNIKLNIHYRTMNELMDLLLHHKVDFVLSYKPMNTPPQIESTPLFVDKLAVIVRKEHSLAARKSVTLADVEKYPMALPSRGLQARMVLDQLLAGSGMTLNTRIETNLVTPLLRLVRKGRLLTILSCSAVQTHPDLCAVPIDDADNMMQGSVHTLKGTYQKVAAKKFLDLLRDTMYLYRNDFD